MSLRTCRECGAHVSTRSDLCVHCGILFPTLRSVIRSVIRTIAFIAIAFLITATFLPSAAVEPVPCVTPRPAAPDAARPDRPDADRRGSEPAVPDTPAVPVSTPEARVAARVTEWANVRSRSSHEPIAEIGPDQAIWVPSERSGAWWPVYESVDAPRPMGVVFRGLIQVRGR